MKTKRFAALARQVPKGRLLVPVPFDPDQVWTPKQRHHVAGTINGVRIRGVLERYEGTWGLLLGPSALGSCHVDEGARLEVVLEPEGPQRDDLAPDIVAALEANPRAGAFFDSLAQYYRRAYLRWIDATKRRPEQRAIRITEMVQLLEAGRKERPNR